jgi:hypothetical protein
MTGELVGGDRRGDCARPSHGNSVRPGEARPQSREEAIALCRELLAAAGLTVGDLLWDRAMAQGRAERSGEGA